jgi:hypothetical protein
MTALVVVVLVILAVRLADGWHRSRRGSGRA